jgi:hypothetical protein
MKGMAYGMELTMFSVVLLEFLKIHLLVSYSLRALGQTAPAITLHFLYFFLLLYLAAFLEAEADGWWFTG